MADDFLGTDAIFESFHRNGPESWMRYSKFFSPPRKKSEVIQVQARTFLVFGLFMWLLGFLTG